MFMKQEKPEYPHIHSCWCIFNRFLCSELLFSNNEEKNMSDFNLFMCLDKNQVFIYYKIVSKNFGYTMMHNFDIWLTWCDLISAKIHKYILIPFLFIRNGNKLLKTTLFVSAHHSRCQKRKWRRLPPSRK